jgi:hypothetical protein
MGSRKRKKKQHHAPEVQPARPRKFVPIVAVVLIVGAVAGILYISWPEPATNNAKGRAQPAPVAAASTSDSETAPAAARTEGKTTEAAQPTGKTGPATPAAAPKPDATAKQTATASAAKPGFEVLKGRWQRPDGGYVVDIRSIDASGKLVASYFNPRPINVSKAEASQDGSALRVFIELRDANYPGSTYTLIYDPQNDQLRGIYYQAVQQQRFEVAFMRMN